MCTALGDRTYNLSFDDLLALDLDALERSWPRPDAQGLEVCARSGNPSVSLCGRYRDQAWTRPLSAAPCCDITQLGCEACRKALYLGWRLSWAGGRCASDPRNVRWSRCGRYRDAYHLVMEEQSTCALCQLNALVDSAVQLDWRPSFAVAEDLYAL